MLFRDFRVAIVTVVSSLSAVTSGNALQDLDEAIEHHLAGRIEAAVEAYQAVIESTNNLEDLGTANNNLCVMLINRGEYDSALAVCDEALRLRREQSDQTALARSLNNAGLVHQYVADFEIARELFREALRINGLLGDIEGQLINLANLGLTGEASGRYHEALEALGMAAALAERHASEPWARDQMAISSVNRGVVLEKLGAYREALSLFRRLYGSSKEMAPEHRASIALNLGVLYRNLGDPVQAMSFFEEASNLYRRLERMAELANVSLNRAITYHRNLDDPVAAEEHFVDALMLAGESGDSHGEIETLFYYAHLQRETGRLDEAREHFERCGTLADGLTDSEGRWACLEGLARIAENQGRGTEALRLVEASMTQLEAMRATLTHQRFRSGFFGDKRSVYALAVRLLWELNSEKPNEGFGRRALEIAERAKARDLLDTLGNASSAATPPLAELIRGLGPNPLVEYFVGEQRLFAWTVLDGAIEMFDLGASSRTVEIIREVHLTLATGGEPLDRHLERLSNVLVIFDATAFSRDSTLFVAPDGLLHYMPFELLYVAEAQNSRLIEETSISYVPSFASLAALSQRPSTVSSRELNFLGVTAPAPDSVVRSTAVQDLSLNARNLPELPLTRREIARAADRLGGNSLILTGEDATETRFRESITLGARIVHVAAHAVVEERLGIGATILLAPSDGDDGLVIAHEIAELATASDLVVLSACRTALGTDNQTVALSSLTGAFLASGSKAVVATLWDVGDQSAAAFMDQFYYFLTQGMTPTESLRAAKLRFIESPDWRAPTHWAGYVLVGDSGSVSTPRNRTLGVIAAIWTLLIVFFGTRKLRGWLSAPAQRATRLL